MSRQDEILEFWLPLGEKKWFSSEDEIDQQIRLRFMDLWGAAWEGGLTDWQTSARGMLAYLIVTDQFPRNMFRGDARSFATDELARSAARRAVMQGLDLQIDGPGRCFFYLPFEHAESLGDQDWGVDLTEGRILDASFLLNAKAHREIIRRFGRFPFRNKALGRQTTAAEQAFIDAGGYGALMKELAG